MASLGSANPDNVCAVEVVQVLLEVTLSAKANRIVVEEAHWALVLLVHGDNRAR
jgi:hypothetical protein